MPPIEHSKLVRSCDLTSEPIAAGTMNTTIALQLYKSADVAPAVNSLVIFHLGVPGPMDIGMVLQSTFPRLITNWSNSDPKTDPNMIPNLSHNDPKLIPKRSLTDLKLIPK